MKLGLIGLGKMGMNLALNMLDNNINVLGYDKYLSEEGKSILKEVELVDSIKDMIKTMETPRAIWVMVPSGTVTETVLGELLNLLEEGDIVMDGGNSKYTDTMRRHQLFQEKGLHFLDVGTSGGQDGARNGACLMIGGEREVFSNMEPLFEAVSTKDGYSYMGKGGSGHYVKMVHNGIEYGMMQAIGEGFDLLEASNFDLDYRDVAKVWANGSIIEGLLMNTVVSAINKDPKLDSIEGRVDDSGEGQWTIEEALKLKVSIPVIAQSLFSRYKSKDDKSFSEKVVASMRNEFGGHKVYKK